MALTGSQDISAAIVLIQVVQAEAELGNFHFLGEEVAIENKGEGFCNSEVLCHVNFSVNVHGKIPEFFA